eukprot:c13135_g1_i1 orf=313-498(-)
MHLVIIHNTCSLAAFLIFYVYSSNAKLRASGDSRISKLEASVWKSFEGFFKGVMYFIKPMG